MKDIKYKYRINEILNQLPVNHYRKAIQLLPKLLNVSTKTFANYRNIKINDTQDIPHEKVALLEKLLDLNPGGLQNYVIVAEPIFEQIDK